MKVLGCIQTFDTHEHAEPTAQRLRDYAVPFARIFGKRDVQNQKDYWPYLLPGTTAQLQSSRLWCRAF